MTQGMTSFVLRFVREVSEEQGGRWRGLIQHVQSGTERNFTSFADALNFMQGWVLENTVQVLERGDQMPDRNPFGDLASEMARMWGDLTPQLVETWARAAEQMMGQSLAVRTQVDQAVDSALKAWGLAAGSDQVAVPNNVAHLAEQVEQLKARVEALEQELAAQGSAKKSRRARKRTTSNAE